MKSLILKAFNFTFMVDGISDNTDENSYKDQDVAVNMIFKYLNNPAISKDISTKIDDFSAFLVSALNNSTVLKNAVIDGRTIKGTVIGEPLVFNIDSLVSLDIRDFKILDFKRVDPLISWNNGEASALMEEEDDGEYVSFKDYQKLMQRVIELEMQG
jgi:hypothetical protein